MCIRRVACVSVGSRISVGLLGQDRQGIVSIGRPLLRTGRRNVKQRHREYYMIFSTPGL